MILALLAPATAQIDGSGPLGIHIVTTPDGTQVGQVISAATEFLSMPPGTELWRFDAAFLEDLAAVPELTFTLVYAGPPTGPEVDQALAWEPAEHVSFTQPQAVEWQDITTMPGPTSGRLFQGDDLTLYLDWDGSQGAVGWVQPAPNPLVTPGALASIPFSEAPTDGFGWIGAF